jgi:hypothetical protein
MSEHRVPMLGTSWRRYEDPVLSRDPRVRAVVAALATLPSPEPRPEFRAELRAQLVAIAPRIISESAEATTTPLIDIVPGKAPTQSTGAAAARPRHTDSALARIRRISIGRPLAVAASVITAFAILFGGAVWMSQKALPGDTLYGLKRASESWQLATDTNPTDKARDYLKFANTRVDEAHALAERASASAAGSGLQAGGFDSHTADLIESTLASADHDVTSASSLLGKQAVQSKSSSPLDVLTSWAPDQLSRLRDLASAMPDGALRARTQSSARLVRAAVHRANKLAATVHTGCPSTSSTDQLGPLPISSCPSGSVTTPKQHNQPKTKQHRTKANTAGPNAGANSSSPQPNPSATTGPTDPGSSSPSPIISVPPIDLPTSSGSLPLTVNSCSLGLTLGPINVGVGSCDGG